MDRFTGGSNAEVGGLIARENRPYIASETFAAGDGGKLGKSTLSKLHGGVESRDIVAQSYGEGLFVAINDLLLHYRGLTVQLPQDLDREVPSEKGSVGFARDAIGDGEGWRVWSNRRDWLGPEADERRLGFGEIGSGGLGSLQYWYIRREVLSWTLGMVDGLGRRKYPLFGRSRMFWRRS